LATLPSLVALVDYNDGVVKIRSDINQHAGPIGNSWPIVGLWGAQQFHCALLKNAKAEAQQRLQKALTHLSS